MIEVGAFLDFHFGLLWIGTLDESAFSGRQTRIRGKVKDVVAHVKKLGVIVLFIDTLMKVF